MIESRIVAMETVLVSTGLFSLLAIVGSCPSTPRDKVARKNRPSSASAKFTVKLSSGRTALAVAA
jgi:hypothetical protein